MSVPVRDLPRLLRRGLVHAPLGARVAAIASSPAALHRALIAIVIASFVLLATWTVRHGAHPNGAWAPGSSDHYSHVSSTILFWHRGTAIYTQPMADVCPRVAAEGVYLDVARGDVCNVPERAGKRPLVTNWPQFPRPYPPGWALWHAPVALLHELTAIPFVTLNRLMVVQDLAAAHLALYALAALLLLPREGEKGPSRGLLALRMFFVALAGSELVRWAMLGYYDGIAVALVVFGIERMHARRDVAAVTLLSAAIFFHFRAMWVSLPLLAWIAVRARELRTLRAMPRLLPSVAMLATAAGALLLVRPALRAFPATNPILWFTFDARNGEHWNFVVPLAIAITVLAFTRAFVVLGVVAFQLWLVMRTPQVQPWHALSLLPLYALARTHRSGGATEVAAAALILVECRQIFEVVPLPGAWLSAVFQAI